MYTYYRLCYWPMPTKLPNKRKILVANVYRDWRYLGQDTDESASINAQLTRWKNFLVQWEKAIQENKEVHVIGDTNLDFLRWGDPSQPISNQTNRLQPLVNQLFERIFPYSFVQLVSVAT